MEDAIVAGLVVGVPYALAVYYLMRVTLPAITELRKTNHALLAAVMDLVGHDGFSRHALSQLDTGTRAQRAAEVATAFADAPPERSGDDAVDLGSSVETLRRSSFLEPPVRANLPAAEETPTPGG